MLQVDEASDGKEIELAIGEMLEVCLPENRTTGFKWIFESSGENACTLAGDNFEPHSSIGQTGNHRWQFRAQRAGSGSIRLSYRRPWDEEGKSARTFTLGVRVPE